MAITKEIVFLRDFEDEAQLLRDTYGKTNLYSTGVSGLDWYLGGGFGRDSGYEIVVLFGSTGIGKSLVGLNFLRSPIEQGKRVGVMALEDDGPDIFLRFTDILGPEATNEYVMKGENVVMMPPAAMSKSWKLDELLELIESWFINLNVDIILLDHLQFAFENAESIRGENEYTQQRVFMQRLNHLMKRVKKTIVLISHVNKDNASKGLNKIVGSGSIAQAGTKVIEVVRDKDGVLKMQLHKSRFTRTPDHAYDFAFVGARVADAHDSSIFPGRR